jgi:extracellular factor (EF) 3-hydroxypalmitic acid methyl ester biosynthesis protein
MTLGLLTEQDERGLFEYARHARYQRGEIIVHEGATCDALFVIAQGFVRIERGDVGGGIAVARRGPGEVLGEMSFLEGIGASASLVADTDVEAAILDGDAVRELLASTPGLETRLYHSLARVLAARLRELTADLPRFVSEDVPQGIRSDFMSGPRSQISELPATLVEEVERFKSTLLQLDRQLKDHKIDADAARVRVAATCDTLAVSLGAHVAADHAHEAVFGRYVFRETFAFFMQSRFIDRSFTKPRGYAGDYATIDMLYENTPAGDGRLGPLIDSWILQIPPAQAVRNRRELLSRSLRRLAAEWSGPWPMAVTSVASGPARELLDVFAMPSPPRLHATCIDIDPDALLHAANIARRLQLTDCFTFVQDNVIHLAQHRGHTALEPQALMYSVGLTDYLQDRYVLELIDWAYEMLLPGGVFIIGNVVPTNPSKAFMDYVLEWPLIHRSEAELRALVVRSRFGHERLDFELEPAGVDLFAFCRRGAA